MRDRYYDELCDRSECNFCDDDGIRLTVGGTCDHVDWAAISKRGMAKVRQALRKDADVT